MASFLNNTTVGNYGTIDSGISLKRDPSEDELGKSNAIFFFGLIACAMFSMASVGIAFASADFVETNGNSVDPQEAKMIDLYSYVGPLYNGFVITAVFCCLCRADYTEPSYSGKFKSICTGSRMTCFGSRSSGAGEDVDALGDVTMPSIDARHYEFY